MVKETKAQRVKKFSKPLIKWVNQDWKPWSADIQCSLYPSTSLWLLEVSDRILFYLQHEMLVMACFCPQCHYTGSCHCHFYLNPHNSFLQASLPPPLLPPASPHSCCAVLKPEWPSRSNLSCTLKQACLESACMYCCSHSECRYKTYTELEKLSYYSVLENLLKSASLAPPLLNVNTDLTLKSKLKMRLFRMWPCASLNPNFLLFLTLIPYSKWINTSNFPASTHLSVGFLLCWHFCLKHNCLLSVFFLFFLFSPANTYWFLRSQIKLSFLWKAVLHPLRPGQGLLGALQ